jgi:hypothetical protein
VGASSKAERSRYVEKNYNLAGSMRRETFSLVGTTSAPLREPRFGGELMGKKVKVVTKCGEIHNYEYKQEVETVEIVESKKYKNQDRLNQINDEYEKGCGRTSCGDCAFHIDISNCAFVKIKDALREAQGYET